MTRYRIMLLIGLLAAALPLAAQQVPVTLTQALPTPPTKVMVLGQHKVTVVADTADYISALAYGDPQRLDELALPDQAILMAGSSLTVGPAFPYPDHIEIHTTSPRLHVEAGGDSRVELRGIDKPLRLQFLRIAATDHGALLCPDTIECPEVHATADGYGAVRYRHISSPRLERRILAEGHVMQVGVDDEEGAFRFTLGGEYHRFFGGWSVGALGWSEVPFGGMAAPMGSYAMGVSAIGHSDLRVGYNLLRWRHVDVGAGLAYTVQRFSFGNAVMGVTLDSATGSGSLDIVDEPVEQLRHIGAYHPGEVRIWRCRMNMAYLQVPLRIEWHHRSDYQGWRMAFELRPAVALRRNHISIVKECTHDNSASTSICFEEMGRYINPFRLDARLDLGWNHFTFFIHGSLTSLFRTRDARPFHRLDSPAYPLAMGFSLNL